MKKHMTTQQAKALIDRSAIALNEAASCLKQAEQAHLRAKESWQKAYETSALVTRIVGDLMGETP